MIRYFYSVSLGYTRSTLSIGNNPSPEGGTVGQLFKMFCSQGSTKFGDRDCDARGQPYALNKNLQAVS